MTELREPGKRETTEVVSPNADPLNAVDRLAAGAPSGPPAPPQLLADFERFYEAEFATMVRVAFFLVGSQETAEEIVQDAFIRLYDRWATLARPGGYLRSTVVNGCRDRLRRRHRFDRRRPLLVVDGEATGVTSEQAADRAVLMAALADLPLRCRTALVLRFYGGLSESEIAEAMGVAPGTVKSFIHRGLTQLREGIER